MRNDLAREGRNYVGQITRPKIEELIEVIGSARRIAVKTHAGFPRVLSPWLGDLAAEGKLRAVASYRDPRDICLSLLDAGAYGRKTGMKDFAGIATLDDAADYVERRILAFEKWAALEGTLMLDYETVAFAPHKARPGRHREELTPEEHARLTRRFGDFIDRYVRPCGP